jgi:hypothetical protein
LFPHIKAQNIDLDSLSDEMIRRKEELESANTGKFRERTTMAAAAIAKGQNPDRQTRKEPGRKK